MKVIYENPSLINTTVHVILYTHAFSKQRYLPLGLNRI